MHIVRTIVLLAVACWGVSLLGCSSSGSKAVSRSEKTVDSLADYRQQVLRAGTQLDRTMSALDGVMNASSAGDNRKKAFDGYMSQVKNLKSEAEDARDRAQDLRSRSKEYVAKWQQEVATVSDPALKAQADARRAKIQDRIDEVEASAAKVRDAYQPLMKSLTDIQTVLANDLTAAGVQGVGPTATTARQDAVALKQSLDAFAAELEGLMGSIGPRGAG